MAKDRIELGDIEARLGRSIASSGNSSNEFAARPVARTPKSSVAGGESSGAGTLFVSIISIVVAAGAGAFLAMGGFGGGGGGIGGAGGGGGESANSTDPVVQAAIAAATMDKKAKAFHSRVADVCDKGWKDDRINRDQIHCYMTREVRRLCDPMERRALADKWRAYQAADDRMFARLTGASMSMALNPAGGMAIGIADAKSRDPNLSAEEREAQMNKAWEAAGKFRAPADQVLEESMNETSQTAIVQDVAELAKKRFLSAADFPGKMPKLVAEGLAKVGTLDLSTCP